MIAARIIKGESANPHTPNGEFYLDERAHLRASQIINSLDS
jgi:hypothetical protein